MPGPAYTAVAGSQAAGSSTFQQTLTSAVALHDVLVVGASSNSQGTVALSVADSKGNKYVQQVLDLTRSPNIGIWVCQDAAAMVSGTDTITVTFSGTSTIKNVIARGCPGLANINVVDQRAQNDAGATASPSAGPTKTLFVATEWAVAFLTDATGGGTPTSWTGGFTAVTTVGAGPFMTVADQITAANTALTAGATIVSATWEMGLITLSTSSVPPPLTYSLGPPKFRPRSSAPYRPRQHTSAGFTPPAAAPAPQPVYARRRPQAARAIRSTTVPVAAPVAISPAKRTTRPGFRRVVPIGWAPPVSPVFQPLPAFQRAPRKAIQWYVRISRSTQLPNVPAPAVTSPPRRSRPWPVRPKRPAVAPTIRASAPAAPILRGRMWPRRPARVQFAPKQFTPPPATVPVAWWKRVWRSLRRAPQPVSVITTISGTLLPQVLNCSAFVVKTISCEPTSTHLLLGETKVVKTLSCEARKL